MKWNQKNYKLLFYSSLVFVLFGYGFGFTKAHASEYDFNAYTNKFSANQVSGYIHVDSGKTINDIELWIAQGFAGIVSIEVQSSCGTLTAGDNGYMSCSVGDYSANKTLSDCTEIATTSVEATIFSYCKFDIPSTTVGSGEAGVKVTPYYDQTMLGSATISSRQQLGCKVGGNWNAGNCSPYNAMALRINGGSALPSSTSTSNNPTATLGWPYAGSLTSDFNYWVTNLNLASSNATFGTVNIQYGQNSSSLSYLDSYGWTLINNLDYLPIRKTHALFGNGISTATTSFLGTSFEYAPWFAKVTFLDSSNTIITSSSLIGFSVSPNYINAQVTTSSALAQLTNNFVLPTLATSEIATQLYVNSSGVLMVVTSTIPVNGCTGWGLLNWPIMSCTSYLFQVIARGLFMPSTWTSNTFTQAITNLKQTAPFAYLFQPIELLNQVAVNGSSTEITITNFPSDIYGHTTTVAMADTFEGLGGTNSTILFQAKQAWFNLVLGGFIIGLLLLLIIILKHS